jgi:Tfp pilus assembly protein PilX
MKRAMALVLIWGIIIVMCFLALAGIYLMGNQGFVAEKKILRTQAFYTARSGMVHALEDLKQDGILNTTSISVDQAFGNLTADIDYSPSTKQLNISVDYTR